MEITGELLERKWLPIANCPTATDCGKDVNAFLAKGWNFQFKLQFSDFLAPLSMTIKESPLNWYATVWQRLCTLKIFLVWAIHIASPNFRGEKILYLSPLRFWGTFLCCLKAGLVDMLHPASAVLSAVHMAKDSQSHMARWRGSSTSPQPHS